VPVFPALPCSSLVQMTGAALWWGEIDFLGCLPVSFGRFLSVYQQPFVLLLHFSQLLPSQETGAAPGGEKFKLWASLSASSRYASSVPLRSSGRILCPLCFHLSPFVPADDQFQPGLVFPCSRLVKLVVLPFFHKSWSGTA
jgi:hypothetical protein